MEQAQGMIRKMRSVVSEDGQVRYHLPFYLPEHDHAGPTPQTQQALVDMSALVGRRLRLEHLGELRCVFCGRKTKKSFSQGYCFPCSQSLAQCDMCIVRPETCHYALGSCREPSWGEQHCMIAHTVYLAKSSNLKVGITREHQRVTRWVDQGAAEAVALVRAPTRKMAGDIEVFLKAHYADRTKWQAMLKGEVAEDDLAAERLRALAALEQADHLDYEVYKEDAAQLCTLQYPVLERPKKVKSFNLDKDPLIQDTLQGIHGQYLIFAGGVINMRKYAGYRLALHLVS